MEKIDRRRRDFLRNSGGLALSAPAFSLLSSLALINEAAAAPSGDYKALVCVYLDGGNDYANTVIPYDDPYYNQYFAIRNAGGCAITKAALTAANTLLTPTTPLPGGRQYALHPKLVNLASLFNTGKAAVQLNVGPLISPITRAQYNAASVPVPPKLFSHNDQRSVWFSSSPEGSTVGWGGRLGDVARVSNSNPVFSCITLAGNTVYLAGNQAFGYGMSTAGPVAIGSLTNATPPNTYGSVPISNALAMLIQQPSANMLANEYNKITARSITSQAAMKAALDASSIGNLDSALSGNTLATQLHMVAKTIDASGTLGIKRQVFFVSLGGFDQHVDLLNGHGNLLSMVDAALKHFYDLTVALGVANKVTTFTCSEFGRTLSANGDGSDHGWGGHHFVIGGAVKGKAFYGTPPSVDIGATEQDHIGLGRLIPSTSVDQYAATLAKWHGVPAVNLPAILPNLSHFGGAGYPIDIGFMT